MQPSPDQPDDHCAITQLLVGWGLWRNTRDWLRLRSCYANGARMRTTCFEGSATDFIDASQRMAASGKTALQHYIGTPVIHVHTDGSLT